MSNNINDDIKDRCKEILDDVFEDKDLVPILAGISGSHIYGMSDDGSDIDLRAVHAAKAQDHTKLDDPDEQIIINQDGLTQGYEEYEEIDLVSYELKKYGKLLHQSNFNVIEWGLEEDNKAYCNPDFSMRTLKDVIRSGLPGTVPYHYYGMARHNFNKYVKGVEEVKPKMILYVLRGIYGAEYTRKTGSIEPDIRELYRMVDHEYSFQEYGVHVKDLLELKQKDRLVPHEDLNSWIDYIVDYFSYLESLDLGHEPDRYKENIDKWMGLVRASVFPVMDVGLKDFPRDPRYDMSP